MSSLRKISGLQLNRVPIATADAEGAHLAPSRLPHLPAPLPHSLTFLLLTLLATPSYLARSEGGVLEPGRAVHEMIPASVAYVDYSLGTCRRGLL
jgi:hypothetical protein